jgi:hypothetical protein
MSELRSQKLKELDIQSISNSWLPNSDFRHPLTPALSPVGGEEEGVRS